MFPELAHLKEKSNYSGKLMADLREKLSRSQNYKEYLLKRAAEERGIVLEYLRQEIDFDEKYAFLEYWGRGYTQDCLTKLQEDHYQIYSTILAAYIRRVATISDIILQPVTGL